LAFLFSVFLVDTISFAQSQNSPTTPNTHSIKRFATMHPFQTQTRVIGILSPELISLLPNAGPLLAARRQNCV
jgi:hypothetical protein